MTSWAESRSTRLQADKSAAGRTLERLGGIVEQHRHAATRKLVDDRCRHLPIERGQDLILQLHERDRDVPAHQVLDHFEADKTATHDDRPVDAPIGILLDAVCIVQVSQRENAREVDAGNRRPLRRRPRARISLSYGWSYSRPVSSSRT